MIIFSKDLSNSFFQNLFIFSLLTHLFLSVVWGQDAGQSKVYYEGDGIRIQQKQKIITITGNAFIRKGTQGLKADKIIWYQNQEYAEAFNNVSFLDREQGVLYRGDYVKFLIERDTVFVREKASIENRKDKIIIFSDSFEANTKSGTIFARGNTRMQNDKNLEKPIRTVSQDADYSTINNRIVLKKNALLKTVEQWFSADQIDINQDKNFVTMNGNVRIEDSPEQKSKVKQEKNLVEQNKNSLGDSVLTCERSKIFTETKYLECFKDVILENKADQTLLKSQYFLFDNTQNEVLATEDVSYYQKNPTNERYMFSQYMKIYQNNEVIYFTNDVVFIDMKKGKTNFQLDCYSMKYLYAENSQNQIECNKDVILYNPEEQSRVFSDYLFYQVQNEVGYVEKKPVYLNEGSSKDTYFYSQRMDIDRKKKLIKMDKDVRIVEKEKDGETNSIITCNEGNFLYYTEQSDDIFTCSENVDVYMTLNNTHFYGDQLTYYLQRDYSYLEAKSRISFKYERSATNRIQGAADYVENFHDRGYSIMSNKVLATEMINGRPVNRLQAQEMRYHFLSQSNVFEGFREVVYENLDNDSILYSDYLFYDLDLDIGWSEGSPVLLNRDQEEKINNLVYADFIQLNNKENVSQLRGNIYIFKSSDILDIPSRKPEIPEEEDYMTCQEANYYFVGEENRMFECVQKTHIVDKENKVDIFSDYMIYDLETDYGFLKEKPYLINRANISNTIYVYSETMEFFLAEGISLFHTNVITKEIDNLTEDIRSTIKCDESKYVFGSVTNTVECFQNVEVINHLDSYVITGNYVRHQVDEDYSYVTDQAKVAWEGDGRYTSVTADLLESFGEENLLYAKGNVKVDNGENQAESSLGIYEPDLNKFTLYGNPLVRDKNGSEFTSEEVYFDVVDNRMTLGSDVGGNFISEGFLEQ